ncbi:MAG: T9SS type A sorting domain-containing protein [Flavobacteriaceae bacterium]|nr:T9SS type A sorting domain-containing protein [Flavobacteriaceae bacterium]
MYPNPTRGLIQINSVVDLGATDVSIYDMNGRRVWQNTLTLGHHTQIDASALSSGIYLIKIDGGNYSHTTKLIIR